VPLIAQSAPQVPGVKDTSRVAAGTYTTDPGHTLIGWRVSHFGFNDYFGIFGDATGTLTLDPEKPQRVESRHHYSCCQNHDRKRRID